MLETLTLTEWVVVLVAFVWLIPRRDVITGGN